MQVALNDDKALEFLKDASLRFEELLDAVSRLACNMMLV